VKCIKCDADNNLKDRKVNHGKCKNCRHVFAFDPKVMPGVDFTDKFFQQTIHNLSVNNSLFFTPAQFYFFFNQRRNAKKPNPLKVGGGCVLAGALALNVVLYAATGFSFVWFIPLLLVAALALALLVSPDLRRRLSAVKPQELGATQKEVAGWVDRWRKVNGDVAKLLRPPAQKEKIKNEAVQINPELRNYSFDRAVICDHAEIAQCLIANNFHFEYNCAVLSIDGYPHEIFEAVMEMLRRNQNLSVYALHDASIRGVELTHTLSTNVQWFAGTFAKIYDLGLLPRQIFNRSVFIENTPQGAQTGTRNVPAQVAARLQPEEVRWLESGNYVVLESFSTQMLMRSVAQGIAKSRDPNAGDALVPVTTDGDRDGGVFIYTWDSFG
jgi:hypothetical protein